MLRRERGGENPPEDSSLGSDWQKRSDDGRPYYVNVKTQERTFKCPFSSGEKRRLNNITIPASGCFGGILADEMGLLIFLSSVNSLSFLIFLIL